MGKVTRLYEVEHPYYCNEGNYFNNDCTESYDSWRDFVAAEGDSDPDMNLLFRFDWEPATEDDGDVLLLFWMGQRKGLYRPSRVCVSKADEPEIRKWLRKRLAHLLKLWAPLVKEGK